MNQSTAFLKVMESVSIDTTKRCKNLAIFCEHPFIKKWNELNDKPDRVSQDFPWEKFEYHSNYGLLMQAIEKIRNWKGSDEAKNAKVGEYFIDEFKIGKNSVYIRLIQWVGKSKGGWRMFDDKNRDLSILYVTDNTDPNFGNAKNLKEALFMAASDFATVVLKK